MVTAGEGLLAYERRFGDERLTIALNLSANAVNLPSPMRGNALLSTYFDRSGVMSTHTLRPNEGIVLTS
jgi:hypothetical protein